MAVSAHDASSYIKWIYEKFKKLQEHTSTDILRLVHVEQMGCEEPVCEIQLIGKNIFVKKPISELTQNKQTLNCFSKNDIQEILKISNRWNSQPSYRISSISEADEGIDISFLQKNNLKIELKLNDVDQGMISALSSKDAHILGHLKGFNDAK